MDLIDSWWSWFWWGWVCCSWWFSKGRSFELIISLFFFYCLGAFCWLGSLCLYPFFFHWDKFFTVIEKRKKDWWVASINYAYCFYLILYKFLQVVSCSKCRYQYELVSGDVVSIESEEIRLVYIYLFYTMTPTLFNLITSFWFVILSRWYDSHNSEILQSCLELLGFIFAGVALP